MIVAIIGGSGVYDPDLFQTVEDSLETSFGKVTFYRGFFNDKEIIFLPRHGKGHSVPPHLINYRANIAALKALGVSRILATSAVGSLTEELAPGTFVLLDQFLDFTKRRALLFNETEVKHIDFTEPYCLGIRSIVKEELEKMNLNYFEGCYVCTEGPRYETPAEVRMFRQLGGDVVGMTNVPEVTLAREAGICYACIATVTNFGAGISQTPLNHEEVVEVMNANASKLKKLLANALLRLQNEEKSCSCPCPMEV